MNETRDDDWDPRDSSVLADQRTAYDDMRARCPVARSEFLGWSLFGHDDVTRVLADPGTFSSRSRHLAVPNGMDPPAHGPYRTALASLFAPDRVNVIEARSREIGADLIGVMVEAGDAEFVTGFAEPFALRTLCAFLGWPEELWECLGGWTHGNQQVALTRDRAAGRALAGLIAEHITINLDEHRGPGHAGADVTDALLQTAVDGANLTDEQIVSVLRNWIAGEGTVTGGLSLLVLHLAEQRELQDRLRREPDLIPAAIEELLRFDGPLVANRRTTTRSVEVGGRRIGAGESLTLMWIAANNDPAAFDEPGEIRPDRDLSESLVWGQGIHRCLGAPLAQLQMRVALEELLARTSGFEVAGTVRRSVYPSNALAELGITFDRS